MKLFDIQFAERVLPPRTPSWMDPDTVIIAPTV